MSNVTLKVSDFTRYAFNRYREDGDGSGEEFREDYLVPALKKHEHVTVNLDGIYDEYGSSFLSEAFANLIRKEHFSYNTLQEKLTFKSNVKEWVNEVDKFINEARRDVAGSSVKLTKD